MFFYKLENELVYKDGRNEQALKKWANNFICRLRNNFLIPGSFNNALSIADCAALNNSVFTE
jgi:hypothetical protein